MRHAAWIIAVLGLSCATSPVKPSTPAADQLHQAVESFFDRFLELNPITATYIGDHRFDSDFGNPASPEYDAQMKENWSRTLKVVEAIDPAALSPEDALSREVFLYNAKTALEGFQFPQRLLPLNQMDSPLLDLAKFGSGEGPQPFETVRDHEAWLERARGFSVWVDSAIAAMKEGERQGVTLPDAAMQNVLDQVDSFAKQKLEDSVFLKPLASKSLSDAERTKLEPEYRAVFTGSVMPAMARLRDFIKDDYLGHCRKGFGWSELPNGDAWYRWRVKDATTTELTPDEIHELGLAEVARIKAEMEAVKAKVHPEGSLQAFFAWARDNPAFYFQKPADLLNGYVTLKSRIDAALPRDFSVFPKANYEVRPVEAFRAESAPGAEYQQPSADGKRPGIFYVNTFNLKAQPKYGMQTLSLHEASPGHHFQISIQQELKDLPRFRRFGGYVAFEEGWALYAETLGKALGLYQEPMDYYGHLADGQLRAMRLVVDTGLHSKGWTREQAIRFMLENSSMAESDVTAEVERYMVWPAQALGYKVGQLRILELRKKAEHTLGEKFDLKRFHAAVLQDGALPMDVLAAKLDRWVSSEAAR